MNPYRLLLISGIAALSFSAVAQQQRIVLQGPGEPQIFTTLEDALVAAQPNDKLYFSGGSFNTPAGGFLFDMPLHFIGAGINPDSSNVTAATILGSLSGGFTFTTGASGSSFTGIVFSPSGGYSPTGPVVGYGTDASNDAPQDMVFERCIFHCRVVLGNVAASPGSTSTFNECIFPLTTEGVGQTTTTFTRCVFGTTVNRFEPSGLLIDHSVFLKQGVYNGGNAVVRNSVFYSPSSTPTYQSIVFFNNNLFASPALALSVGGTNNISDTDPLFVNQTDDVFDWTDDLHLRAGSPGINAADDGTNIGLYGSPFPAKVGFMPYNPHYRQATIDVSTNPNGDLPVNIRVTAQPN